MTHNQSALTTLITEVLADPELAHSDVFRRMLPAGLQELIDAEATVKLGAATHAQGSQTPSHCRRHIVASGRWWAIDSRCRMFAAGEREDVEHDQRSSGTASCMAS